MPQSLSTASGSIIAVRLKSDTNKRIFRALLSLASAALLIRIMGLFTQVVITGRFGLGAQMDAYVVATTLPLFIAQLIVSAVEAAVIPVYTRVRMQGTKEQRSALFSTLLNLLIIVAVLLVVVMLIFSHQLIFLSAPSLRQAPAQLATYLTPFIFPTIAFTVVLGFLESILNSEGQFGWPAYAGVLVPLTATVLLIAVDASQGILILCIGTLIGLCLQLCAFTVRVRRAGLVYRPILDLHTPEIAMILLAAWPVLTGGLITQAAPLVDQIFASSLREGSISALSYSQKLVSVPVGVIFVAVGRAILPYLSRHASVHDMKSFKATLRLYIWAVGIGTLVLSIFMIVLAQPLVGILFQRGNFSATDTDLTATTLVGFMVGLTPMAISFIIQRTFSALGKNKVLMRMAIFTVLSNIVFDAILSHFWQSQGIALATSAVYFCSMFIMLITLRRMIGKLDLFTFPPELWEVLQKISRNGLFSLEPGTLQAAILSWFGISYSAFQRVTRIGTIMLVFAAGVAGVIFSPTYTLRAALGSVFIVVLLRYRYVLLIIWVLFNALNALPIFRGSNALIGLTAPTLLLMAYLPVKQTFQRLPALAFLLIYLVWVFVSIGISAIGVGSFLTIWTEYLDCLAVGVLAINVLTTRRRMMIFIDAILMLTAFIALYGIYGFITKQNGIPDPITPSLYRIGSIFGIGTSGQLIFATGGGGPQTLAMFLSVVIPLAFYRTFMLQGFRRVGISLLLLVFLIALGLTFTRVAYISVPLSIIIMAFFLPSRRMKIGLLSAFLALVLLVVVLAAVGNIPIFSRFFTQDVASLNGRIYLWQAILVRVDPTQLLGHGLRASDVLLTNLQIGHNGRGLIGTSPHNLFLGTLYDHGIIGVTLLLLFFLVLAVNCIAGIRKARGDHNHQMLFAMTLGVIVSVLVQSIETNDFWTQAFSIYFWVITALPFVVYWSIPKRALKAVGDFSDEVLEPRMKAIERAEREQLTLV